MNKKEHSCHSEVISFIESVRSEDFSHAGEKEAIEIMMKNYPHFQKRGKIKLLDVGCGSGGTLDYLRRVNFGDEFFGVDIDGDSIKYARKKYGENSKFFVADAHKLHMEKNELSETKFDVVIMMNVFYELKDQKECLRSLWDISSEGALLSLFDYTNLVGEKCKLLEKGRCVPIDLKTIERDILSQSGWELIKVIDLTAEFMMWYEEFLATMEKKKEWLVQKFSVEVYRYYKSTFTGLLKSMIEKEVGGAILYCKREN